MQFDLVVFIPDEAMPSSIMAMAYAVNNNTSSMGSIALVTLGERSAAFAQAVADSGVFSKVSCGIFHRLPGEDLSKAFLRAIQLGGADKVLVASVEDKTLPGTLSDLAFLTQEEIGSDAFTIHQAGAGSKWVALHGDVIFYFSRSNLVVTQLSPCYNLADLTWSIKAATPTTTYGATRTPAEGVAPYRDLGAQAIALSVVVPTLDATSTRVTRLLESLRRHTAVTYQVLLVDNGNSPQGFSAPVNTGIRAVRTEYVAVINDDVKVGPGWWGPLQRELDSGELVVFPQTIEGTREDFSAWCFAFKATNLELLSATEGAFFDPELRIWFQDSDLMLRLRELGKPPKLVSDSQISHGFSETLRAPDPTLANWIKDVVKEDQAIFVAKWGEDVLVKMGFVNNL